MMIKSREKFVIVDPDVKVIMYNNYGDTNMQIQAPQLIPNDQEAVRLVQHCSKQELQDFLDNEDKLLGVINDLQQVM